VEAARVAPADNQDFKTMTKTDTQLKHDIEEELHWDPKVNAARIGVSVDAGAVALSGEVDDNAQKWAAEDAIKRVRGVRAVAQNLSVKLLTAHERSDAEIAGAIQGALEWNVYVPETVTAAVHYGSVTLAGRVTWMHERDAAERAVRHLKGVVTVHNNITLEPQAIPTQVNQQVQAALQRRATVDASAIHVEMVGGEVTLTGQASSWQSIIDAENAAWEVPGVTQVVAHVRLVP
jgi:osmotically-inducible protein OsmY